MLLLTTQDKRQMIILDRLSAVTDYELSQSESDYSLIYDLGIKVFTAKHEFLVCCKQVKENTPEFYALKEKLKQLKIDIVEGYRKYRDNLTVNNFNDEYYYIDYDFVLRKVNETKETL